MSCAVKRVPVAATEAFKQHHGAPQVDFDCHLDQDFKQLCSQNNSSFQQQQNEAYLLTNERHFDGKEQAPPPNVQPDERLTTFKANACRSSSSNNNAEIAISSSQVTTCDKRRSLSNAANGLQPQQRQRAKPHARRDSLESIQSRVSTSSGAEVLFVQSKGNQQQQQPQLASGRNVLVATRYVAPPRVCEEVVAAQEVEVEDDQRISRADWQTIDLNDADQQKDVARRLGQQVELSKRFSSPIERLTRNCKLLTSGGRKSGTPTSTSNDEQAQNTNCRTPISTRNALEMTKSDGATKLDKDDELMKKSLDLNSSISKETLEKSLGRESVGRQSSRSNNAPRLQIGKTQAPFLFAGILASILGSVFFSMGMLCIKLLPDGHGLAEKNKIVCFRGCIMMLLCGSTIIYQKSTFKINRDELWVNVLRSIFGFTGVYGAYVSLKYISMGDSTALVFSSPIWTSLLSHFILNEPLQWIQLLALPASLVGIIFIAHPALLITLDHVAGPTERQPLLDPTDVLLDGGADLSPSINGDASHINETATLIGGNQTLQQLQMQMQMLLNRDLDIAVNAHEQFDFEHRWKGIVIALATSFIVSFVYIVLKFRKSTPIQTTTFWLGTTTALASLVIMAFIGSGQTPYGPYEWALISLNGLCSWLGQVLLQWALAYEDASVLSVIRTLDVAMTFTLSALFLNEEILWTSVLGAAIIATVVVSIMLNSYLVKRFCSTNNARHLHQEDVESDNESRAAKQLYAIGGVGEKAPPSDKEITLKLEAPPRGQKLYTNEEAA